MNLLERLKAETRDAHDRIEAAVDLRARTASASSYRDLLARLYGFHAAWEAHAKAIIVDRSLLEGRLRAPLLERDLQALGLTPSEIRQLPVCPPVLESRSVAEALGAMYVVEGSTLGGAVIAKQVERSLGYTAGRGCAFFRSYGADLAAMWKAFRAHLLAASSPATDDLTVAAANRTFEHMRVWLAGEGRA